MDCTAEMSAASSRERLRQVEANTEIERTIQEEEKAVSERICALMTMKLFLLDGNERFRGYSKLSMCDFAYNSS